MPKIAIAGASGLLGTALARHLRGRGDEVVQLVRREAAAGEVRWDPARGDLSASDLAGVSAIVNLAGASIADGRWTSERRALIRDSRTSSTSLLARATAEMRPRPALISASGVGIYGHRRGSEWLDEASSAGSGFLADVCRAWEAAAEPARVAGARVASLRLGVVLAEEGGALAKLLPLFRLGLGGRVGSGEQYMSWVSIIDAVRAFTFAIDSTDVEGATLLTSPHPVTNEEFTKALSAALRRPAVVPVPAFALRLALGEMAEETVLASQRAKPTRLLALGFAFEHGEVGAALAAILSPRGS